MPRRLQPSAGRHLAFQHGNGMAIHGMVMKEASLQMVGLS